MSLFRFFRLSIPRRARRTVLPNSERILSNARLRAALQRERMRADRIGGMFSFVHFESEDGDSELLALLADRLVARLRLTDDLGAWNGGVGILLPETPAEGAEQLAQELCASFPESSRLRWRTAVYPPRESGQLHPLLTAEEEAQAHADALAATQLFIQPLPFWKRALDVVVAGSLLVPAAPVLLVAAAAIKLGSPGPVLFRQYRAGLGGQPFVIYKLRTMRLDAEAEKAGLRSLSEQDGPAFKLKNDPRVTRVGKYLRKTCIDELPQLWNVLRGEMTLVGPRPLPCDEAAACTGWQQQRLDVTPGLTCIWQVRSGRSRIAFADWMRLDIQYIRGRSLGQDLRLVWKTFVAVLMHRASH